MPEFARIGTAKNSKDFLRAPIESEMIPCVGDYFLDEFDRSYGHAANDAYPPDEINKPISNAAAVEEEFFERYIVALQLKFAGGRRQPVDLDGLAPLIQGQDIQRAAIGRVLSGEFARLRLDDAVKREWGEQTATRAQREELLWLLLAHGYRPPIAAADLVKFGTRRLPEGKRSAPLAIAKKIAGNPDANKNRVLSSWPRGFFDRNIRLHLFYTAAGRAYRRAYDQFFIWSHVETVRCGDNFLTISHEQWCQHERTRRLESAEH
jgi:hypothetical protein